MASLSFNQRRLIVGVASVVPLFSLINYFFDLKLLGKFDIKAIIASFILLAIVLNYFGPTLYEVRRHRDSRRVR